MYYIIIEHYDKYNLAPKVHSSYGTFENAQLAAEDLAYNYILEHQGDIEGFPELIYKYDKSPNKRLLARCGYFIRYNKSNEFYVMYKRKNYGYIYNSYDIIKKMKVSIVFRKFTQTTPDSGYDQFEEPDFNDLLFLLQDIQDFEFKTSPMSQSEGPIWISIQ